MTRFQDPTAIGRASIIALCAYMLTRLLNAGWLMIVLPGDQPRAALAVLATVYLVSLLLSYILVACWIYRTNANAHVFAAGEMSITPGWSVGWFFIPFANLVMPFRGVSETWRASQKAAGNYNAVQSSLLGWWWGLWIANNIVTNIAVYAGATDIYASQGMHLFNMVAALVGAASALVLIQLIGRLDAAQRVASRGNVFA